ncbi:MAG: hypothetical protein LPK14_01425 [Hymenobacteraceae bacterium]|nr:hypothetical protein [Hymenobacteraceae bacterium]
MSRAMQPLLKRALGAVSLCLLFPVFAKAQAEIMYQEDALSAYRQNFDRSSSFPIPNYIHSSTYQPHNSYMTWSNGGEDGNVSLAGWYLSSGENYGAAPVKIRGNNRYNDAPGVFSYGEDLSPDRAIGIRGGKGQEGVLYAALRVKNSSGRGISRLRVSYSIEQWYFDGDVTQVLLEYAILSGESSRSGGALPSVEWKFVEAVNSPVAAGHIGSRDGNISRNRTSASHDIADVVLAGGQEIVFRWRIATTNDEVRYNGLALDDITITPLETVSESPMVVQAH